MDRSASPELLHQPSIVEGILYDVRQMDDPNDQLRSFIHPANTPWGGYRFPEEIDARDFDALVTFAADDTSSPSLVVRAQALEVAYDRLRHTLKYSSQPDPNLIDRSRELTALLPDNHDAITAERRSQFPTDKNAHWYRLAATKLIRQEGLCSEEYVYPEWSDYSFDHLEMPHQTPVAAFMLLDKVHELSRRDESLPLSHLASLAPLAMRINDIVQDKTIDIQPTQKEQIEARARLCRIIGYGEDHQSQIEQFLQQDGFEHDEYIAELNQLYDAARQLSTIFPEEYASAVEKGAQELVANSIYAIKHHVENGASTDAGLPLGDSDDALQLKLARSEPLALLRALKSSMCNLSEISGAPDLQTTLVTQADSYKLFRLFGNGKQASVYIRPWADHKYDARMEYGRPGEGVEASISFVVDAVDPQSLLNVGKSPYAAPADNRISIRLDREGVAPNKRGQKDAHRDPTQEQGTLSLDVGSVLGDDNWLSTKVGRLLAWGNHLRSKELGLKTGLNHVTHYFSPQDGNATVFAYRASRLADTFEAQHLQDVTSLIARGGALALR